MSGDFGLREALGERDHRELVRRQLRTARQYGETEAAERLEAWLAENGDTDE